MAKNIIFLGAGASAAEGAPMQSNLFKSYFSTIRNFSNNNIDRHLIKYFLDFWGIDVQNDRLDNVIFPTFEEALGMLELAKNRQESFKGFFSGNVRNNIDQTIEDLIFLIAEILDLKLKDKNVFHKKLIENLIKSDEIKNTTFISLNYDILIDNAIVLAHEYTDLDYGIDFVNYQFPNDWHRPNMERSIKLLKVHGSLNWLYCPVCKKMVLTPGEKGATKLFYISKIRSRKLSYCCRLCEGNYVPVLIPPTYFKELSNPFLIQIWNMAEEELKECEKIIFCGYSMPDADIHIKYLIKRGLINRNIDKPEVIIINNRNGKNPYEIENEIIRYKRIFGENINYTEKSFQEFAENPMIYL